MPDITARFDGKRVLADLNTLRAIGAYKTGVHKPTFSEPHLRSLAWLAAQLPGDEPSAADADAQLARKLVICSTCLKQNPAAPPNNRRDVASAINR